MHTWLLPAGFVHSRRDFRDTFHVYVQESIGILVYAVPQGLMSGHVPSVATHDSLQLTHTFITPKAMPR